MESDKTIVSVFVLANQPQHLAVNDEKPGLDKSFRPVCGGNTTEMTVKEIMLPVILTCQDCQWQLDQWSKPQIEE